MSFKELESLIDASPATIRRDLSALEKKGELVRFQGGVKFASSVVEASMSYKQKLNSNDSPSEQFERLGLK